MVQCDFGGSLIGCAGFFKGFASSEHHPRLDWDWDVIGISPPKNAWGYISHNQRVYSRTKVPVFSRDSLPPFCGAEQLRSAEAGTMDAYLPNRGDQGGSSPFVFTIKVEKKTGNMW